MKSMPPLNFNSGRGIAQVTGKTLSVEWGIMRFFAIPVALLVCSVADIHAQTECDRPPGGGIFLSSDSTKVISTKSIELLDDQAGFFCVLYVLAYPEGATSAGLKGAEFGIETTNSDFNFATFWRSDIAVGSAVASTPGGGVVLAWEDCQAGPGPIVIGSILVFSFVDPQPGVTNLFIRRAHPLFDPSRLCAATNSCESPYFPYAPVPALGIDESGEPFYSQFSLACCGVVNISQETLSGIKGLYR